MGVAVWAMVELEADDALASAAHLAAKDSRVEKFCIWTPDKDLAQCVVDDRVVQVDRRSGVIRDAEGVRAKFGVALSVTPFQLALTASRLFYKPCNAVTQFAEAQMQRADISPQIRNEWGIIRDVAVGIGVGVTIHKIYEWANS
jgi:hypothetical protein